MSIELVDTGWDKVLASAVKGKHPELRVICPFIKHRAAKRLITSGHIPKIQVITRFNLADFCARVSDTRALRWLLENGAEIRGVKGLHAKIYLFGHRHVLVTSANLTEAALLRNHEFGFVSKNKDVTARCREYFDMLWAAAGPNLTLERIDEWDAKLTAVVATGLPPSRETGLPDEGADAAANIAQTPGVEILPTTLPPIVSEVDQSFVKFLGEADNRAHITASVFEELQSSGCHWACAYPRNKRPRIVIDGAVMFMGRMMADGDIVVFGRAIAMKYVHGRDDATAADIAMRDWKEIWPHYSRVHHGEFLAGTLENGVRLSHLMDELKSDAFASTQANAARGKGNVTPRRAYRQQAAVRLSAHGFEWINSRLEKAFLDHGKLPPEQLEQLDWPEAPA